MADTNWIKLNRKIWENFIWSFDKPQYALAWIDMLLMANYMDKQILFNGKVETIQRGSFVTSMLKLAERWDMNRKTVKSFLDMLQSNGMITYSTTKRRTTVFITNYLAYQGFAGFDDVSDGQLTGQPTGQLDGQLTGQPTGQLDGHNIRRLKNIKENKEGKEESTVSNDTVCNTDVSRIIQAWNTLGLSKVTKIVPKSTRGNLLNKRIKDYGVESILAAIEKVRQSDFLKGINKNGWTITFDWFIRPDNFAKVLDGNYDKTQPKGSTGGRKEMVPGWMQDNRPRPDVEEKWRAKEAAWLAAQANEAKTVENDPDLAARADALRRKISGEGPNNG